MNLPENPIQKVRKILANALQCKNYWTNKNEIKEKDLYEIKKLCDYVDGVGKRCKELERELKHLNQGKK